jgi:hypothetical protein
MLVLLCTCLHLLSYYANMLNIMLILTFCLWFIKPIWNAQRIACPRWLVFCKVLTSCGGPYSNPFTIILSDTFRLLKHLRWHFPSIWSSKSYNVICLYILCWNYIYVFPWPFLDTVVCLLFCALLGMVLWLEKFWQMLLGLLSIICAKSKFW